MSRDLSLYLADILQAMRSICEFVKGMSFDEFMDDDKTASAVVQKLEIIGEAAKYVPENVRAAYPDVPWKEMAGMRDRLIHFYHGVDYRLVWRTITERIPRTMPLVERALEQVRSEDDSS